MKRHACWQGYHTQSIVQSGLGKVVCTDELVPSNGLCCAASSPEAMQVGERQVAPDCTPEWWVQILEPFIRLDLPSGSLSLGLNQFLDVLSVAPLPLRPNQRTQSDRATKDIHMKGKWSIYSEHNWQTQNSNANLFRGISKGRPIAQEEKIWNVSHMTCATSSPA